MVRSIQDAVKEAQALQLSRKSNDLFSLFWSKLKENRMERANCMKQNNYSTQTVAGTNIEEVKRLNAQSGLSYNEVKELLARTTGGRGTRIYSNTKIEEVRSMNQQSLENNNIDNNSNNI